MPPLLAGRRSTIEAALDILELLERTELPKTHIMYKANLSYTMTVKLLQSLESLGLIEVDRNSKRGIDHLYKITKKGTETVELGKKIKRRLGAQEEKEKEKEAVVAS